MEDKYKIKYEIEFAENGTIFRPSDAPATVHTEDDNEEHSNNSFCLALGEDIYYTLQTIMEKCGSYKFELWIDVKDITEQ